MIKRTKTKTESVPKKILEDIVTGKVCICWTNEKQKTMVLLNNGILGEPKDAENLPYLFENRSDAKGALSDILADTSDHVTTEYMKNNEKAFREAVIVPASKFVGQDFAVIDTGEGFDIRSQLVLKQHQRPIKAVIEETRFSLQSAIDDAKESLKALKATIKDRELALQNEISEKGKKLNAFEDSIGDFDTSLL